MVESDPTGADAATASSEQAAAYDAVLDHVRRLNHVRQASMLLWWDQQVTMPDGGHPPRAKQSRALSRVEADELTYHFHIILRAEIERQFIAGEIDVAEIPAVWNDKMDEYLWVRPATDAEGCLQDIHWTGGFAGFQSHTVGSVVAAQLDAALQRDLDADVDALIREGEFALLLSWVQENVHAHGQRYPAAELIEMATGEPLTAGYFIEYVESKFAELCAL